MTILKTLLTKNDKVIEKVPFLTEKEIEKRHQDYPDLTPKKFATNENHLAFRQMKFSFQGKNYEIQLNLLMISSYQLFLFLIQMVSSF